MCGIVAYCGPERRSLPQELVRYLTALEYRGYDSAGVACVIRGGIEAVKSVGGVSVLAEKLRPMKVTKARVGMAHTRWATHGRVTEENAHPVLSVDGRLTLVMNGVVENDQELRARVVAAGGQIATDCDAATLLARIEAHLNAPGKDSLGAGDLLAACRAAMDEAVGRIAVCVGHRDEPGVLVAVRRGSPLFVGTGGKSLWLASDSAAFPATVERIFEIEDDRAVTFADGRISAETKKSLRPMSLGGKRASATLDGFSSWLEKEISEQETTIPRVVDAALELLALPGLEPTRGENLSWKRVILLGCGSAYHACLAAKLAVESLARIPADAVLASEFSSTDPVVDQDTLVLAVSQSGETADTLAAAHLARSRGARVIAVTNRNGSALERLASRTIPLDVGEEVSVASTKAYTAMLIRLIFLAGELGVRQRTLTPAEFRAFTDGAKKLKDMLPELSRTRGLIREATQRWRKRPAVLFLGKGLDHPTALEGALKLKELSYLHAEGVAAGELKHGPLAMIDSGYPVIAVCTDPRAKAKAVTAIREVEARGADVLALFSGPAPELGVAARRVIALPEVHRAWAPVVAAIPLQWLALEMALAHGRNVDRPRNLAKSVTVL